MRKFTKEAAATLLTGTMAMSLTTCAGFIPSGGNDKKDTTTSSEAGVDIGVTQTVQTSGTKRTIKSFHGFSDEPSNGFIENKIVGHEEAHPDIDIVVESTQNGPYKEKIKIVVGGDDVPDTLFS